MSEHRPGTAHMLDLSLRHVQPPQISDSFFPDFGAHRVVSHTHGYVVFVPGEREDDVDEFDTPRWLEPIMLRAIAEDCVVINFDRDGLLLPAEYQTYSWPEEG